VTLEYSPIQDTVPENHTYDTGLFLVRGGVSDDTTRDKTIYKPFYQLPDGSPDGSPAIKPIEQVVIQSKPIDILPENGARTLTFDGLAWDVLPDDRLFFDVSGMEDRDNGVVVWPKCVAEMFDHQGVI